MVEQIENLVVDTDDEGPDHVSLAAPPADNPPPCFPASVPSDAAERIADVVEQIEGLVVDSDCDTDDEVPDLVSLATPPADGPPPCCAASVPSGNLGAPDTPAAPSPDTATAGPAREARGDTDMGWFSYAFVVPVSSPEAPESKTVEAPLDMDLLKPGELARLATHVYSSVEVKGGVPAQLGGLRALFECRMRAMEPTRVVELAMAFPEIIRDCGHRHAAAYRAAMRAAILGTLEHMSTSQQAELVQIFDTPLEYEVYAGILKATDPAMFASSKKLAMSLNHLAAITYCAALADVWLGKYEVHGEEQRAADKTAKLAFFASLTVRELTSLAEEYACIKRTRTPEAACVYHFVIHTSVMAHKTGSASWKEEMAHKLDDSDSKVELNEKGEVVEKS